MHLTRPASALIRERSSWRTFLPDPIPEAGRQALKDAIASPPAAPFGGHVGLYLVDAPDMEKRGVQLGTYGMIKGAQTYFVGTVRKGPHDMEDFGWLFEWLLLVATGQGLGTCWLGGTLTRDAFGTAVEAGPDDIIPAASPVGLAREKRSLRDIATRTFAGATKRKPWDKIFFDGDASAPLTPGAAGSLEPLLEAIRLAPSASNQQPWRIIHSEGALHLYLSRTPGYYRLTPVDLQRIDMGIAMCHLDLVAAEEGLKGAWQTLDAPASEGLEYVATWRQD